MTVLAFTSCNDDYDGDYPRYRPLITTVHTLDGSDYYLERDNGETLYPSDKTYVQGYKAEDNQRVVILFNLLPEIPDYDYNIKLYDIENIFTGSSQIVDEASELDELGDDPTGFPVNYNEFFNLTKQWMTLNVVYSVTDNSKHAFTLIVNNVDAPETTHAEYLDVELRHNAGGDTAGPDRRFYISFDLSGIADQMEGKKGVTLRIKTRENGTHYLKLDLPREK